MNTPLSPQFAVLGRSDVQAAADRGIRIHGQAETSVGVAVDERRVTNAGRSAGKLAGIDTGATHSDESTQMFRASSARDEAMSASYPDTLVLKHDGEYHFVKVDDILWLGAERDFVKVHTLAGAHLVRQALGSFEAALDPRRFLRIHRSHLVARTRIRKVFVVQRGDYAVQLTDGTELRVSRPYGDVIKQLLAAYKG